MANLQFPSGSFVAWLFLPNIMASTDEKKLLISFKEKIKQMNPKTNAISRGDRGQDKNRKLIKSAASEKKRDVLGVVLMVKNHKNSIN